MAKNVARNVVVVGTQWGDEGKGKIVDWLTDHAKGVVRFQGGHNAGHTLVLGDQVYQLHLVPTGIVRDGVACFNGNGGVLDIHQLISEIRVLESGGIDVRSRLKVSPGCPLILPYHAALDHAREAAKCADARIGTTGKGIGPAYEDKVARRALRVYDLFHPDRFADKVKENLHYHNFVLTHYLGAEAVDFDALLAQAMSDAEEIRPLVADVSAALYAINKSGHNLLFEGAQGALLDIDHGTYPFVTSSNCVAGQAAAGSGIGPGMLHYVLGITKAYCCLLYTSRTLGVRADMTPQVARIDAHLLNRQGVTRLCYCGSVLHTLPASLAASREPIQLGAELFGHAGVAADREVIRLMADVLSLSLIHI